MQILSRYARTLAAGLCGAAIFAMGTELSAQARIIVGENVHVSTAHRDDPHAEYQIAAHPTDPNLLVACSIRRTTERTMGFEGPVSVYQSRDGGKSWAAVHEYGPPGFLTNDPSCAYDSDGTAYFSTFGFRAGSAGARGYAGGDATRARLFRSRDAGRTWTDTTALLVTDPHFIAVDWTGGKYAHRVYVNGLVRQNHADGSASYGILVNRVDGRSMSALQHTEIPTVSGSIPFAGGGAVLSDGTVVIPFIQTKGAMYAPGIDEPREPNGKLAVITSSDGGETFSSQSQVDDIGVFAGGIVSGYIPTVASDRTRGPFRDRLYLVWVDGMSGRAQIQFAYSADKGQTWSEPLTINDDVLRAGRIRGPNHLQPVVAVNKDGVVAVSWLDRRESQDDLGWAARIAVSLDGGETFSPSTRVSTSDHDPSRSKQLVLLPRVRRGGASESSSIVADITVHGHGYTAGEYGGLTASADGIFHPLWMDNRTGVPQLWTASVRVEGRVVRHGSDKLADLRDITPRVALEMLNVRYDQSRGVVTGELRISNSSTDTIRGPFWVRVLQARSMWGTLAAVSVDGGAASENAVVDFAASVPKGYLAPGEVSSVRPFTVTLKDPKHIDPVSRADKSLVTLRAKVFARPPE
jgi:hypothetical protein